jgi:hypothetical protein
MAAQNGFGHNYSRVVTSVVVKYQEVSKDTVLDRFCQVNTNFSALVVLLIFLRCIGIGHRQRVNLLNWTKLLRELSKNEIKSNTQNSHVSAVGRKIVLDRRY